jgi:putative sterol carrier protein
MELNKTNPSQTDQTTTARKMSTAPTAEEIFAAMAASLDDKIKSKFNASVEFRLGEEKPFRLDAKKGPLKESPELTVTTTLDVLHELLSKKLTPQQAFMKGKLKIKGNMGLAMKLTLVMNATRKQLLKSATPRSRL